MTNKFEDYFDVGFDEKYDRSHIINRPAILSNEYLARDQMVYQRLQKKVPDASFRERKIDPVEKLFDSFLYSPKFEELREKFFEKMLKSPEGIGLFDRKLDEKLKETMMFDMPYIAGEATAVVIIEEISRDEAKDRIITYFNENGNDIYPSDISEKLHIDYDLLWEIINELEEEGFIQTGE